MADEDARSTLYGTRSPASRKEFKMMGLSDRFTRALIDAVTWHGAQVRKGTDIPYIAHLLGAAGIALEHGADEDEAIAALLHDAVEDHKATFEEIEQRFGLRVAGIVRHCTIPDDPDWRVRKTRYIQGLAEASESVRLVSASDKLHNARAILRDYRVLGEALWSRFNGRREDTLWYYRELVKAFRAAGPTPLTEELARVVSELESLASAVRVKPPG